MTALMLDGPPRIAGAALRAPAMRATLDPIDSVSLSFMREIVFDTETTGLDPRNGDRIVEIGCIELVNHIPTGRTFHRYVNPERSVSVDAARVHGLDDAFLKDKLPFSAIAGELVDFVGDAMLIAHNATFDLDFLNTELARVGRGELPADRIIDTLAVARRKHPGSPNSLDALCARYSIDTSRRTFHGALLDSELLAEVYVELIGGRQASLVLGIETEADMIVVRQPAPRIGARPVPRIFALSEHDIAAHAEVVASLGPNALWLAYLPRPENRLAG